MLYNLQSLLLLPFFLGNVIASVGRQPQSISVHIRNGTVFGVDDDTNQVLRFLGVPYAQPPVGDLRLRHAIPLNKSFGSLHAKAFGPVCVGPDIDSNPNSSEDCRTLNICRPFEHKNVNQLKPVLVWFYGGGLQRGYTADPIFNGTNIVRISSEINKEIVLVSVNYRLGPLGFLNGQQMADLDLLNLGMLYANLNPFRVASREIRQSSHDHRQCVYLSSFQTAKPQHHTTANTDEGTTSAPIGINATEQLSIPLADGFFRPRNLPNSTVSKLLSLYHNSPHHGCPYNTGSTRLTPGKLDKKACSIFGDVVQIGPARTIAQWLSKNSRLDDNTNVAVYRYRFNHLPQDTDASNIAAGIGTGLEERYVFSNLVPDHPWDRNLAYEMSSVWISFAHDLDPNPRGESTLPFWPEYGDEGKSMVFSGYGSSIEEDTYRAEAIEYIIETVLPDGAL
ncbi:Alpha/Beta hydrolase protein [Aspergillus spectabilis]